MKGSPPQLDLIRMIVGMTSSCLSIRFMGTTFGPNLLFTSELSLNRDFYPDFRMVDFRGGPMATGCSKVTSITIFGNVLDGVIAKKKKKTPLRCIFFCTWMLLLRRGKNLVVVDYVLQNSLLFYSTVTAANAVGLRLSESFLQPNVVYRSKLLQWHFLVFVDLKHPIAFSYRTLQREPQIIKGEGL